MRSRGRSGVRRRRRSLRLCLTLWLLLWVAPALGAQPEIGGDFSLTDHHGRPFSLQQLRGKLVLLFFGYTYCPDVCPTELSQLAAVQDALGPEAQRVQGLFITLDPERDTPAVLRDYTRYFDQRLLGLTGTEAEVAQVAQRYRVNFKRHARADGDYSLDHTANLYVIDGHGELAAVVPYGLPPEHLLALVRGLLTNHP